MPRAQPYQPAKFLQFPLVVASQIPVLAALVAVASLRLVREGTWSAKLRETWTLATILGAAVSVAAWARPGGYANNLMTTYVFAVIPAFVELHRLVGRAADRGVVLLSALGLQLLRLGYNPAHQIPGRADYEAGAMFVDGIRAVDGPVLVPQRPWLAVLAGKGASYHANAYWEWAFLQGADWMPDDLRRRLEGGFYKVVALDADPRGLARGERSVPEVMDRSYVCDRTSRIARARPGSFAGASMPGPAVLCRYAPAP